MNTINTMLIIDIIIVILGIYLLFLAIRMKKTKKVEKFVIDEESMRRCKNEAEFAEFLSIRQLIFSIVMIIGGVAAALSESVFNIGKWEFLLYGVIATAFLLFYKELTDGRVKYC